jgi:3-methyladenine DNA glycosylase AlkD
MQKRTPRKAGAAKDGPAAAPPSPEVRRATVAEKVDSILQVVQRISNKGPGSDRSTPSAAQGLPLAKLQTLARRHGRNHELAAALWAHGSQEARILAILADEPALVTAEQMDLWSEAFENRAVCDAACFHLFDRAPQALDRVAAWSREDGELRRRAAFALLAGVALHDEERGDGPFRRFLPAIEAAAVDERSGVRKAVGMALKAIGGRSQELNEAAVAIARRLAAAEAEAPRRLGADALRALTGPAAARRLAARTRAPSS